MSRASIVIVGAGIAGLAAAWELSGAESGPTDATPRIELIEANERCGGSLATTEFAGRTVDLGADGFLARRPEAVALALELGLEAELEAIAESGAWLYSRGALHELPKGLVLGVPTNSRVLQRFAGVSWRARAAARRDERFPARLNVEDDISIGAITRRKLGRELSYQFIEPMIGGIQAGRIDHLSAKSIFPALFSAAQEGGSLMRALQASAPSTASSDTPLFYSLLEGVGSLPAQLVARLVERGVVVRTRAPVTSVRRTPSGAYPLEVDTAHTTTPATRVIFAAPAAATGALIGGFDPALADLQRIDSAGAAIVTFSIPRASIELPVRGTGVLVPLGTPGLGEGSLMVTALTFLDRKWPRLYRRDDVLLRAHVGRIDDTRWRDLDDHELSSRVLREMGKLLGSCGTPSQSLVQRWPEGLPQYRVGHGQLIERARDAAATFGFALAGNAYDGVGVPASVGSGRRAARALLASSVE